MMCCRLMVFYYFCMDFIGFSLVIITVSSCSVVQFPFTAESLELLSKSVMIIPPVKTQ